MSGTDSVERTDTNVGRNWRGLYVIGAVSALVALAGTFADIVITMIPGWEISTVPTSTEQWFDQLQTNSLLGLRNLDLLNIIISVIGIPMYVALYGIHRNVSQGYAALALVVTVLGTAVFITNNAALPMLDLSRQYATATTETQRLALHGAAQALLAKGAHGSMGAIAGFLLPTIGTLLMAFAMLKGTVFGRLAALTGIVGTMFLLTYIIGSTFALASSGVLMAIALPGGLLMIAWNVMVAKKLIGLVGIARD